MRMTLKELRALIDQDMDKIHEKYIDPILSSDPSSLETIIEDSAKRSASDFAAIIVKIMKWMDKPSHREIASKISKPMETFVFSESVYRQESLETFREAVLLQTDSESYLVEKYGDLIMTNPVALAMNLQWHGLEDEELSLMNIRLYLSILAAQKAIRRNEKKLSRTFDELSRLCLKYAEEKDSAVLSIDYMLDQDKRVGLLKSHRQFEKLVKNAD